MIVKIKKMTKDNTLKELIKSIREKYGDDSIHNGIDEKIEPIGVIPTPSPSLNKILGINGVPRGRITEIIGSESAGKSSLALSLVAEAQRMGITCSYIDSEHAVSFEYARMLGVDLKKLIFVQNESAEEAMNIVEDLLRSKKVGLIIIDSVASLSPQAEIDGDAATSNIGLLARIMGRSLRKITSISSDAAIVFINQYRQNISSFGYADPIVTPGGNALKYFSSVRIDMKRSAKIKKGDEIVGNRVNIKIIKNKLATPFKTATYDYYFSTGIDRESDLINFGLEKDILKKEGNSVFFGDLKLGGTLGSSKKYLEENKETYDKILEEIKKVE
jgi:recombination protein RecA